MLNKIITLIITVLVCTSGLAQIEVDRVEEDYVTNVQTPIIIDAARSVTIKPDSHLKSGSNVSIHIDEDAYIPPTFTTGNYVFSRNYQTELTDPDQISSLTDVIEKITYYDGLGRASQDIEVKYTPYRYDLIKPFEYDDIGRQAKEFLPYKALGDNALYRSDALTAVNTFYLSEYGGDLNSGNPNPFSEKEFEDALLGRTSKQASPGYDWRLGGGNEIEFDYKLNSSSDGVRYFEVTFTNGNTESPQLVESGSYASNQLTREVIKDENHSGSAKNHTKEEFKDKRGRVVLKRTYADTGGNTQVRHDTYYVYDDYDNLTFVIPPEASKNTTISATILNNICYQYKYDFKNRLIEKKIPGKGGANNDWETIVYNVNDQPILTQDPNLKTTDSWLFTKYDAYGRIAYTGRMVRDASRATLQGEANNASETFVRRKANYQVDGENVGYYNTAYPTSNITEIYTINYYDNYTGFDMEGLSVPSTVFGISTNVNATGLPTCTKVRILDWPQNLYTWVTTVIGYDEKGRVIYEVQETPYAYDSTITNIKESRLDFTGRTLEAKTTHKRVGSGDIVTTDIFEYDHMGRLLTQTQTLGGQTEVLVSNVYDELGNVKQKKLGNTESSPLQTVDYKYNIRGWLKEINNVNSLGNDLFAYKLNFNSPEVSSLGANALYNGNIAETLWRSKNDDVKRAYGFTYDAMNRIKTAAFTDNMAANTGEYATSYSYDLNGNIQRLVRNGWQNSSDYVNMDNLVYNYENNNPNKLVKVQDNGNDNYGFKDLANTATEYLYDANGNLTDDANKEITNISYNHLNLPVGITLTINGQTSYISYLYDASGAKLTKTVLDRTVTPNVTTTTLYAGNHVYQNGSLKFINHAFGYLEPATGGTFNHAYHLKDYTESVRMSFMDTNGNGSIDPQTEIVQENNFYPFGKLQKGYNSILNGSEYTIRSYQAQELHNELGLELTEFKYRFYDATMARFWNIDPKAEDYTYNATYTFSENKLGMGIELEGAEVYDFGLSWLIVRRGQEVADLFNGGLTKMWEASTNDKVVNSISASKNPSFDTERARIERATKLYTGMGEVAKATSDASHFALEVAGASQIPIVAEAADGVNAVWYYYDGDYANATLSGISLIPLGIGDGIGKGGKGLLLLGKAHKLDSYTSELLESTYNMFRDGFGLGISGVGKSNTIIKAMYETVDSGGKILFDLGDVSLDAAKKGFDGKSFDEIMESGNVTEWELSKILRNPDLLNNTMFHLDGVEKTATEIGVQVIE
ncbi:DUF6443 domain-containing protein [Flagellimonas pacifica]|uniref:DUF6443 domain-containing protein n=1 Tax=Flagellimonas pacifica TaxID=1247520 RepID=A0A285MR92_9FLAO|nr:DUF6443 domain-containing protein [Allomuricauda parva]SNY99690.1 hypothetical protein SAMN06265377_1501 [Allomuricauda parva]